MDTSALYAALLMPKGKQLLIGPFQGAVRAALRRFDGETGNAPLMLPGRGMIAGDAFCVHIGREGSEGAAPRLVISIAAHDPQCKRETARMMQILAFIVEETLNASGAHSVEWLSPRRRIAPDDFAAMHSYTLPRPAPRAVPGRGTERRLGAASWLMAAMLVLVSLPIAVFVVILGVRRGLDLRLTTHALVLTGFAGVLHVQGILAGPVTQALF